MKIYVASSWRNELQQHVVNILRVHGFDVYDFKDSEGFNWKQINSNWQNWKVSEYIEGLEHDLAKKGFSRDFSNLDMCDAVVLLLPCGASAHIEAAWAAGTGHHVAVLIPEPCKWEPELMYKMFGFISNDINKVIDWLRERK